jgi:hypothetical protein
MLLHARFVKKLFHGSKQPGHLIGHSGVHLKAWNYINQRKSMWLMPNARNAAQVNVSVYYTSI